MWIQILLVAALIGLGLLFMRRTGSDSHLAIRRMLFGLFVIIAIVSVIFPGMLSWLAQLVGVGRGADLLLYALVVAFLLLVFTQYRRNLQLQRSITLLARRIALLEHTRDAERVRPAITDDKPTEDEG